MYVIGISCFYHDAAAAILHNGKVLAAAEEERFSRIKHDHRFPVNSINFCLDVAGININEVDYVVFYEKPAIKFERVLSTLNKRYPETLSLFRRVMNNWGREKLWIREIIQKRLKVGKKKILFSEHHLSHMAHSFFLSPFEDSATLTIDGVGEWITTSLGTASNNGFKRLSSTIFPHSIGLLYSAFTEFLGFEVNEGEYKVMGMAPYGEPIYKEKLNKHFLRLDGAGFELDMDYFSYEYSSTSNITDKFVELWGEPRKKEEPFFLPQFAEDFGGKAPEYTEDVIKRSQHYANIAASLQEFVEDVIIGFAKHLKVETGLENICISGGVANNSVANGRIIRESGFKNVFVPPGPGDSGAAIGAALAAYRLIAPSSSISSLEHPYLGKEYSHQECKSVLDDAGYKYKEFNDIDETVSCVSKILAEGKVIGWHQGRFEFGPRALGCRSILADPRSVKMKEVVNARVKFRELFRPFAPSCIKDNACEYYQLDEHERDQHPYKFMQSVVQIKPEHQNHLEAVTHVDGSARLQVVDEEINSPYYKLIKSFGDETGTYTLLNTSFNRRGEPIVSSPSDALTSFEWCGIDALVLGNLVLER